MEKQAGPYRQCDIGNEGSLRGRNDRLSCGRGAVRYR